MTTLSELELYLQTSDMNKFYSIREVGGLLKICPVDVHTKLFLEVEVDGLTLEEISSLFDDNIDNMKNYIKNKFPWLYNGGLIPSEYIVSKSYVETVEPFKNELIIRNVLYELQKFGNFRTFRIYRHRTNQLTKEFKGTPINIAWVYKFLKQHKDESDLITKSNKQNPPPERVHDFSIHRIPEQGRRY